MKKALILFSAAALALVFGCGPSVNPAVILPGRIIYTTEHDGGLHIISIDPQGADREALTSSSTLRGVSTYYDACPLPDSSGIIAVANIYGNQELVLVEFGPESRAVQLTHHRARSTSPSVTPDGRQVVYASDMGGDNEIYLLDLSEPDREPERLTRSKSSDTDPVVRPDGRFVVFASDRPGAYDLYAIDLEGVEPLRRLTDEEGDGEGQLAPRKCVSSIADGYVLRLAWAFNRPWSVRLGRLRGLRVSLKPSSG